MATPTVPIAVIISVVITVLVKTGAYKAFLLAVGGISIILVVSVIMAIGIAIIRDDM